MVDKYDDGKRNYEIIMSLNNINNNNIMNDLETINQTNNINYKVEKILEKYQQMSCYSPKTIINNNRKNKLTILNNNQQYYNSECLKHLIRFPLFKINLKFSNNSLNEAYLLNRKIKVALIEFYRLKEIFNILERNKIINDNIKYQDCDKYYPKISKYLKENQISYITDMKQFETGGFRDINKIDTNFTYKSINNKNYIDDFEIIDGEFFSFSYHKIFNTRLQFFRAFI